MQLLHLRGRKTNERVLRHGTLWRGKTMNIRWMRGIPASEYKRLGDRASQGLYIGTFASLALSKRAVDRNRMRRRCREALRITMQDCSLANKDHRSGRPELVEEREGNQGFPFCESFQLLVSPRSSSLSCDFRAILNDVRSFFILLHACPKHPANGAPFSNSR
ncbi:MAG: ribonuclease P protein component [Candidatus Peribacteraceae bacterium]|nr:ribonuclease P protein component [Candidatus Peribacteraceae bacterium]MDD5742566.1 ribonuclease P protein component [Candidatus Peribacteraceae bacterium]